MSLKKVAQITTETYSDEEAGIVTRTAEIDLGPDTPWKFQLIVQEHKHGRIRVQYSVTSGLAEEAASDFDSYHLFSYLLNKMNKSIEEYRQGESS